MKDRYLLRRAAIVSLAGVFAWGCQSTPEPASPEPTITDQMAVEAEENVTRVAPAEQLKMAIARLQEGDQTGALAALDAYRKEVPSSQVADRLRAQITAPIDAYFPNENFQVTLAKGQSLSHLAKEYLGDALSFYALARYNGVAVPSRVAAGQTLLIPATESALAARAEKAEQTASNDTNVPPPRSEESSARTPQPEQAREAEAETNATSAAETEQAEDVASKLAQQTIDEHYQAAVSAFSRQDLAATISHADAVLAIDPGHTNASLYKARAEELQAKLEALNASQD